MRGKTALITGGARGLGRRTAEALAQKGVSVIVNYLNSEKEAFELAGRLEKEYCIKAAALQADVSKPDECERMVGTILADRKRVDILIHNAGPYISRRKTTDQYSLEEWNYIIQGNLSSLFYLTRHIVPYMRSNQWGRVITFGYDRADTAPGWIYRSAYAAAKTGAVSLTRTIALEEAKYGITANMICPGDITLNWKEKTIGETKDVSDPDTPVGRPGTGEDVARVASFLCEEESGFITGAVIPVCGGKDVLGKFRQSENAAGPSEDPFPVR